ncbi:flap endonuclease GEN isoform X1 [Diabrotica virgifera virgifera]|uniref:Flap endonuclease GEN n=1 Tax=Diabrotica virgifera virgifera TaxID=50390 RepID=A0ABM5JVB1_DIAVI|nr:flap endonuclease GEN isoform X1 [Diabrotica virgifera virgifera]
MGIKHLWTVLTPYCERKPLYELQGKTVAVDLSCWICEAQNIAEYQIQPRMYLRNLYFRACYMLLLDVNPVFILEGRAPELKYDTIAARNALQFKGAKPKTDGVKTGKDRSRFNFVLKRCEEMLGLMGISCLKGKGEAESLCAYLNDEGLVDACISQDSDCFAYGAKIVYRNFSIASQGANKSSGGAVDIYDITKAIDNMNFGRNKIIAMALLCGSDYSGGVQGIGKESVLKLFEDISDNEILDKLRDWRANTEVYKKYENKLNDKNLCTSCGHLGKARQHTQKGCVPCGMSKGCSDEKYKIERAKIKNEVAMRSKALKDPEFPDENLIKEFLTKKDHVSRLDLEWKQPDLVEFVRFTTKFLQWEEMYSFEKILPILTRWQCTHYTAVQSTNLKNVVQPSHIKKTRNPKGVPSYEIIWSDPENYFKNVIPKEQIEDSNKTLEQMWTTIEPQEFVNKAYPKLVETFQLSKIKPKKATRRRKKAIDVDDISDMLKNTSISEPKPKKTRRTNKKGQIQSEKPLQPTLLDNFLKRAVIQSHMNKQKELEDINENNCHTSTPLKCKESFVDMSCFGDEDNDSDLSDIIENIISRKPRNFELIANKENECEEIHLQEISTEILETDLKVSSFFMCDPVEHDLFENTFNEMYNSDDNDSTIEYDFEENKCLENGSDKSEENSGEIHNDDKQNEKNILTKADVENEDSFCEVYVPLIERLKTK